MRIRWLYNLSYYLVFCYEGSIKKIKLLKKINTIAEQLNTFGNLINFLE